VSAFACGVAEDEEAKKERKKKRKKKKEKRKNTKEHGRRGKEGMGRRDCVCVFARVC